LLVVPAFRDRAWRSPRMLRPAMTGCCSRSGRFLARRDHGESPRTGRSARSCFWSARLPWLARARTAARATFLAYACVPAGALHRPACRQDATRFLVASCSPFAAWSAALARGPAIRAVHGWVVARVAAATAVVPLAAAAGLLAPLRLPPRSGRARRPGSRRCAAHRGTRRCAHVGDVVPPARRRSRPAISA